MQPALLTVARPDVVPIRAAVPRRAIVPNLLAGPHLHARPGLAVALQFPPGLVVALRAKS